MLTADDLIVEAVEARPDASDEQIARAVLRQLGVVGDAARALVPLVARAVADPLAVLLDSRVAPELSCANRLGRAAIEPSTVAPHLEALAHTEHMLGLAMRRSYRRAVSPEVRAWQQTTVGVGEHLLARLLGTLGPPRIARPYHWESEGEARLLVADQPFERSLRQLWAYCGHGDPARRKRRGMTADEAFGLGSPRCKMLVHLSAEACMKNRASPYRAVYDQARAEYASRDWTDGHRHAAALRLVGKEFLRGLWTAAA